MSPQTPYTADLGARKPLAAIRESADRFRQLAGRFSQAQFGQPYAPGKWTARQILLHLVQSELALGTRARMALTTPNYAAQAFNQDHWMAVEDRPGRSHVSGAERLDSLLALMAMNRAFFEGLSPEELATTMTHPEYGELTVDWILHQLAGHQIHHLEQIESIARV